MRKLDCPSFKASVSREEDELIRMLCLEEDITYFEAKERVLNGVQDLKKWF